MLPEVGLVSNYIAHANDLSAVNAADSGTVGDSRELRIGIEDR